MIVRVKRSTRNATGRSRAVDRWRALNPRSKRRRRKRRTVWRMPYGKHKGAPLASIPSDYLAWMVRERHTFADKACRELARRPTREGRAGARHLLH